MSYSQIFKYSKTIEELRKYTSTTNDKKEEALAEWKSVRTLLNSKHFNNMLSHLNMSESEFSNIIDIENIGTINSQEEWEIDFSNILSNYSFNSNKYNNKIIEPFILYIEKKINILVDECKNIGIEKKVLNKISNVIEEELFNISGKVLAIELDKFKRQNDYIENSSGISNVFFQKYMNEKFSNQNNYIKFFEEYPTLARILTVRTKYLLEYFREVLLRTNLEKANILNFLETSLTNLIIENIDLSVGDSHKQGRSVCILNFNCGDIVYKPKNLEINKYINNFSEWFTKEYGLLDIKFPEGLYRKEYSYIEYIDYIQCMNEEEAENFYTRFGYLIALTYIFNITDIHLENLISYGEYPIIVDIETSFQNAPPIMNSLYLKLFEMTDLNSIKLSLLLPSSIEIETDTTPIDLSALIGKQRKMKHKVLRPVNLETDNFRYENLEDSYSPSGKNIPQNENKQNIDYKAYSNKIIEGFEQFLDNIISNKEEVLEKISEFKNCKIRVLLKGTDKYHSLIKMSDHPNYNRKMKYRERFFMNIWSYPYKDKRPIISEIKDLLYNDIPVFETYIKSNDIFDSFNHRYRDYFNKSGFDIVREKIKEFSEKDYLNQKNILLTTLGVVDTYLNKTTILKEIDEDLYFKETSDQSRKIADYIKNKSITYNNQKSFINLSCDRGQKWSIVPSNESLYDGISGIALMYLLLFVVYREDEYYEYYKSIMKHAIYLAEKKSLVNAFQGFLSPLYPIILENKYLGTSIFSSYIDNVSSKLLNLINSNVSIINRDFISGSAGILNLIHSAQLTFGEDLFPEKIISYLSQDLSTTLKDEVSEIGIAHGVSGMVLTLIKVRGISEEEVINYLSYEDTLSMPKEDQYKWCRGVSGKLQARLKIIDINTKLKGKIKIDQLISEFEQVLKYIPQDDCLCHGTSGIISTIKLVYEFSQDEKWLYYLKLFWSNVHINQLVDDYNVNKVNNVEALGLFDGLSGILWVDLYIHHDLVNIQTLEI